MDEKTNDNIDNIIEKRVYNKILSQYREFQSHHKAYIRTCIVLLIALPLTFMALMIGLESKLEFMTLWIVSILSIIAVIVIIEYRDYWYRQILELDSEKDEEKENENRGDVK